MKRFLPLIAIIVLVLAFGYGHCASKFDVITVQGYYRQMLPNADHFEPIDDRIAKAVSADGDVVAYLGISSHVGYGGPILVGTVLSASGDVIDVIILEHKETLSYINKITQAGFFRQFTNKQAGDALSFDYDIEGVSGATLSTQAIALSVQNVAHAVALKELKVTPKKADVKWNIDIEEIVISLLFLFSVFISRFKKLSRFRFQFLIISVLILGFWLNRSLSMAQISALFLGYFPSPGDNLIWYLVLIGVIGPILFTGKNIYCTYVCPFCGLQEVTHKISRINLPIGKYLKWFRLVKEILLFIVLFLAFISLNPSVSSFEPFGTMFGLNGSSYQWYLLFIILLTSFFYHRFWCFTFCPVGTFLDKVAGLTRRIRDIFSRTSSVIKRAEDVSNAK